jgi:hypothetical protein
LSCHPLLFFCFQLFSSKVECLYKIDWRKILFVRSYWDNK